MSVDVIMNEKISKTLARDGKEKLTDLSMKKSPNCQGDLIEKNQKIVGRKNLQTDFQKGKPKSKRFKKWISVD